MPSTSHRPTSSRVRAADEQLLVSGFPLPAEVRHDLALDLEPERLGIDEQPVHVEQDGLQCPPAGACG
jgi:hypothetical protein